MRVAFGTAVYSVPLGERGGEQQLCFDAVAARMATTTKKQKKKKKLGQAYSVFLSEIKIVM